MSRWFRVYDTLVDDPKVQRLAPETFKALVNLWCLACRNEGELPSISDIAFSLRTTPAKAKQIIVELKLVGLIDQDVTTGADQPHNWNGRQFKSDVSNERVKHHRQRQRNGDGNVTPAVTATPPETEQNRAEAETETATRSLRSRVARSRRKTAFPLPEDWCPTEASRARAKALGFSETQVLGIAEDLRIWAEGKGEVRANWDATFDGFVRRDAKENRALSNGKIGPHDVMLQALSDLKNQEPVLQIERVDDDRA